MSAVIQDVGSVARDVSAVEVINPSSIAKAVSQIRGIDTTGVDRLLWSLAPPMSVLITPLSVFGATLSPGAGTATTDIATANVAGGTAPYSYVWTLVSHDGPVPPTINAPAFASTDFTQTSIPLGQNFFALFRCTVTDSTPGSPLVASNTVNAAWADIA